VTVLGIDFGLKRIGVAFSDPDERIAFPGTVLTASGSEAVQAVVREAESRGVGCVVVGLPRSMDGSASAMTRRASAFAAELQAAVSVPVVPWDERLTSAQADRAMLRGDLSRKQRKKRIDPLAAQLMLQSYLDARRKEAPS
jgi:putative Holliday junction resolvase